ncbi:hypothetical protein CP532_1091 [Ophiocordyceps camponoti-leonardi (nom. inval.)]|nr:hypothetical protein CP532_1091 [Ophiocordyceps camponoti-leonardi (nom. inval.)]
MSRRGQTPLPRPWAVPLPQQPPTPPPSSCLPRYAARSINNRALVLVLMSFVALSLFAAEPVAAVRVPVTNCLADSRQSKSLQWRPLYADASFGGDNYNLQLVVWGNVSGSLPVQTSLPPADDEHWHRDSETAGKIIESADPDAENKKATTLFRKVNVLTYEPWNHVDYFCKNGLVNGSCPLGPVFHVDDKAVFPFGLPSINLSHDFLSSYSFASFSASLRIVYGDAAKTEIGCMSAVITPDLASMAWLPRFLPLVILLISALSVVFAAVFSPWGSTSIVHWSSNYGRDVDLLRLVTPGFGDCLQYIQFVVLTGALSLSYPGYYQPVVSRAAWSALMFNQSAVTGAPSWQSVVDGIYVTNSTQGYGLQQLGQLTGVARSADIWPGLMVCLCVILVGLFVLIQACFFARWLWRRLNSIAEEDLRAKNAPFTVGIVVRIVFNYMLVPVVALSTFQLVVGRESSAFTVALAVVTLALLLVSATWMLAVIIRTRPKSVLFDDLPTVLRIGPLYNTYSDEVAAFALMPVMLNFIRGVAIGAVQPSGVAQVVLLAICEVIQIFTLHAFRPFPSPTSMNACHTVFSILRAVTLLLMVAFVPSLGVAEGRKSWIGYVILLIHGGVLVLGFFLRALKTVIEVLARMLGAGGDDVAGLRRGGLSKIFGMRQLSRRETHRPGISRASHMSTSAILEMEDGSRAGHAKRVRSASTASLSGPGLHHRHRSSSALDSIDLCSGACRNVDNSVGSHTPGETTAFSFLGSPMLPRHAAVAGAGAAAAAATDAADPYYRPPRRRRETLCDMAYSDTPRGFEVESKQPAHVCEAVEETAARGATQLPPIHATMDLPPNRPDYATREVDFYYGVRGPALNSEGPGRKLGTGPADPTGPVATATGWFRTLFKGKTKEKGKGFEVVRSSRMPPAMARGAGFGDEEIPVAMGVLRNGPIDSDSDSDDDRNPRRRSSKRRRPTDLLTDTGDAQSSDDGRSISNSSSRSSSSPSSPVEETAPRLDSDTGRLISPLEDHLNLPAIPRKSSKRNSGSMDYHRPLSTVSVVESAPSSDRGTADGESALPPPPPPASAALPFERTGSQRRPSSKSSVEYAVDLVDVGLPPRSVERPASFGVVRQHGISRIDPVRPPTDLLGSSAEVVDDK